MYIIRLFLSLSVLLSKQKRMHSCDRKKGGSVLDNSRADANFKFFLGRQYRYRK